MKQYKILLSNVGYCTGLNGSYLNYILRCHRYFYRPQKVEKQVLKTLKKIIDQEHPDLCCLIEIEDVHAKTRAKQFKEMKHLTKDTPNVIICGDFNIFGGLRELKPLLEDKRLHIVNTENDKTFPAHCPNKVLDIFIVSKNITVNRFNVLRDQFSDHLPVIFEFKI